MAEGMPPEEVREAVREAIVTNLPVADAHLASGRSSMPIYIDEFMALVVAAGEWLIEKDREPAVPSPDHTTGKEQR